MKAVWTKLTDISVSARSVGGKAPNFNKRKEKKMSLEKEQKQQIIKDFAVNAKDTGSPEVQIAILTEKIKSLSAHMKSHPQDFHSRRGLMKRVAKRSRLLKYVKESDAKRYDSLITRLGLRK